MSLASSLNISSYLPPMPGLHHAVVQAPPGPFRLSTWANSTVPPGLEHLTSSPRVRSRNEVFAPVRQPFLGENTPVGKETFSSVVRRFGHAQWLRVRQLAGAVSPDSIQDQALDTLGRGGYQAETMRKRLGQTQIFVRDLNRVRRQMARLHPGFENVVDLVARRILNRGLLTLGRGHLPDDAAGTLRHELVAALEEERQARAAAQERAIATQVEAATQQQIHDTRFFWIGGLMQVARQTYVETGRIVFEDIEEMEKHCPPGRYRATPERFENLLLDSYSMAYEGGGVTRPAVRQADGSIREVMFFGDRWVYADEAGEVDRSTGLPFATNDRVRTNPHWNADPRAVRSRVNGSIDEVFDNGPPPGR